MTPLEGIQNAAIDGKSDLGEVLRKCKVLAARLGSKPLEDWLVWESNGYPVGAPLPHYRTWRMQLKGDFFGYGWSQLSNAPIPASCIPGKLREAATLFKCRESVATIQVLLCDNRDGVFIREMSDFSQVLGKNVLEGMNCASLRGEFGRGNLVEVLNAVRNRILDFVIAMGKENPEAGITGADRNPMPSGKVTQIFNTTVYGGSANVAGAAAGSTVTLNVQVNNVETLEEALRQAGVDATDIAELVEAVKVEPKPCDTKSFGPRVAGWMSRMVVKAATGAWDVGVGAAGNLLASAIAQYYGLPS